MWWKNKKKKANKTKTITLLDKRINELYDDLFDLGMVRDMLVASFIVSILVCILFTYIVIEASIKSGQYGLMFWSYLIVTPLFIIFGVASLRYLIRYIRKVKSQYNAAVKQRDAEKIVQGFLEQNLTEEYRIFKNIYTGYGDIDAIVVGPTGTYLIEIKSNSGLIVQNEKGYLKIIEGDSPQKNYRAQVIKEVNQVKKYIANNIPNFRVWINPILVFPFGSPMKNLILDSAMDNYKIPVLNEKDLLKYIYSNNQYTFSKEQVEKISQVLSEWQKE